MQARPPLQVGQALRLVGHGAQDRGEVVGRGLRRVDEVLLHAQIARVVQQDPARRLAVAARAPDLLVAGGDRAGHVGVDDVAQVALVDAHAERVGRGDGAQRALQEGALQLGLALRQQPRVVRRDGVAAVREPLPDDLRGLARGAVDEAAAGRLADERVEQLELLGQPAHGAHAEREVRPVHGVADDPQRRELGGDVALGAGVGGGGEREHAHGARGPQATDEAGDLAVRRAEVVAPGRDAVGLVDHDHRRRQPREEALPLHVVELLGRHEQHRELAAGGAGADVVVGGVVLVGVDGAGRDAEALAEVAELVAHQRQQRRDDQGDAGE
ncbi:MAG: hypothetical protein R3F59_13335 [Myxococcota bacterium]